MPLEREQIDEIAEMVSNLMDDTQLLLGALSSSMPKVGRFLKSNWRSIASMTTVGLTAYAMLRGGGPLAKGARRSAGSHGRRRAARTTH
jgi:hypothetical protein